MVYCECSTSNKIIHCGATLRIAKLYRNVRPLSHTYVLPGLETVLSAINCPLVRVMFHEEGSPLAGGGCGKYSTVSMLNLENSPSL